MLRFLPWALISLIAVGFVLLHRGEWGDIGRATREADGALLLGAALLQALWMVAFGAAFWGSYRAVDAPLPFRRTLAVSWAANFINMVVKSGGMGGMALFLREAAHRNQSGTRATLGYLLAIALSYVEFLVFLAVALVVLWLGGDLRRYELTASAATFALLVFILGGAAVIVQSEHRVRRTYGTLANIANAFGGLVRRGPLMDPLRADHAGREAEAAARLVRRHPGRLFPTLAAGLSREAIAVLVMYAVLRAFDAQPSLTLALAAYTLTILSSYISILPSGLGIVELSLSALLIRSGVPAAPAALTAVVYRLFQFWTPFLVGAAATRLLGGRGQTRAGPSPGPSPC
jgi:uncharacterized membrane protein YbhN (UPF0104 family)